MQNYSLESFHCSAEQHVHSGKCIDFYSWCDSATITSLLKKLQLRFTVGSGGKRQVVCKITSVVVIRAVLST